MGIQKKLALSIGTGVGVPASTNALLTSANARGGMSFRWAQNKTINTITVQIASVAGTQALRKATMEILSDVNQAPGVNLATSVERSNFVNGELTFTFTGGYAVTANTPIWFSIKNTAVAPTVDTFRASAATLTGWCSDTKGASTKVDMCFATSTDVWGTATISNGQMMSLVEFADGTYDGWSTLAISTLTACYGNNVPGIKLTSPSNAKINLRSIEAQFAANTSTPTGTLTAKIKVGATWYPSAITYVAGVTVAATRVSFAFATPVSIPPSTTFYVGFFNSAADSAANCFNLAAWTLFTTTGFEWMRWWGATASNSTDSGTTMVDVTTILPVVRVIFDTDGEFTAPTFPAADTVDPLAAAYGWAGSLITPIMDVPALAKVAPSDTLRGVAGTMDLPAIGSVVPPDTLEGVTGAFDEAVRNTITPEHVENAYPYVALGIPEVGGLGSASSQSSRSDSSYSHSSYSDSSYSHSSYSDSDSVSSSSDSNSSSMSSDSSDSSSSLELETGECIQAQITAKLKALLGIIKISAGYQYDVAAVEQARKVLEINDRWEFILLCENEPDVEEDLIIRTLEYPVWFFSKQDDELIGDAAQDKDSEIAYHNRNAVADITKAINTDIYLGGLAENVEIGPGTHELYIDENTTLFGTWCIIKVTTSIDATNPYKLR